MLSVEQWGADPDPTARSGVFSRWSVCPQVTTNEASVIQAQRLYSQSAPPKTWPYVQTGRCHWTHPAAEVPFAGSYPLKAWAFILKKNFSLFTPEHCDIQEASQRRWPSLGPCCLHTSQRAAVFQQENRASLITRLPGTESPNKHRGAWEEMTFQTLEGFNEEQRVKWCNKILTRR